MGRVLILGHPRASDFRAARERRARPCCAFSTLFQPATEALTGRRPEQPAMQTQGPFFDALAKMMAEAAGAADGVRREAETVMRGQLQRLVSDMNFASRDEFEAVRDMARAAREENERLKARLEALEARIGKTG
jgi:hypothetical protein